MYGQNRFSGTNQVVVVLDNRNIARDSSSALDRSGTPKWAAILQAESLVPSQGVVGMISFYAEQGIADDAVVTLAPPTFMPKEFNKTYKHIIYNYGQPDATERKEADLYNWHGPIAFITDTNQLQIKQLGIRGDFLRILSEDKDFMDAAKRFQER